MLTVTDLFAGAGGSSQGLHQIPGVEIIMAANHWDLAVASHAANFPNTRHDCADISQVDPRRYPRTDILWASPECTNHSIAKGKKSFDPSAIRSRSTMWDVLRFAEHHRYEAIIVENVVDVVRWAMWDAWCAALTSLGYVFEVVYLNSMHATALGDPACQDRARVYVLATRKGNRRPDLAKWTRPRAHCSACDVEVDAVQTWKRPDNPWGKYRSQYFYICPSCSSRVEPAVLPALSAIDLTVRGQKIGERSKPLAPKTMRRIVDGLVGLWPDGMLVPAGGTWNDSATSLEAPFRTRTTRETEGVCFPPLLVPVEGRDGKQANPATRPMRTMTTRAETALLVPPDGAFIAELRGGGSDYRSIYSPLATVCASGNHHMLISYYGRRGLRGIDEPLSTVTGTDRHGLISMPGSTELTFAELLATLHRRKSRALHHLVSECVFRMLLPREIGAAMAFGENYVVLGSKRHQVKQYGNAVTPPAARDLGAATVESITGASIERLAA